MSSELESTLKFGFFDSQWDSEREEYDRKYTSSDFNTYFKGIISQNGVFNTVRTPDANVHEGDGWGCFEIQETTPRSMSLFVHAGKGMVYGHWAELPSGETVTFETADNAQWRRDGIVLRYEENTRKVKLMVKKGGQSTLKAARELLDPLYPTGYDVTTNSFSVHPTEHACEIMLAWVDIAPRSESISSSMVTSTVGMDWCPWITHLVIGPSAKDVDAYLAKMMTAFNNWFMETQSSLQINTNIVRYTKSVMAQTDGTKSVSIKLKNMTVTPSFEDADYILNEDDIITVYYNGLAIVNKSWFELTTDSDDDPVLVLTWLSDKGFSYIPKGNSVDIVIEKSRMGGIANCINEYY